MKRLALSLLVLLGSMALAQPSVLPQEDRFDTPVSLQFDDSLPVVIEALARSVGLVPVLSEVPETVVYYNIDAAFRTVWTTVLALHDLEFLMRDENIVVVGPASSIQKLRDMDVAAIRAAGESDDSSALVQEFYGVQSDVNDMAQLLRSAVPGLSVEVLSNVKTLLVRGTSAQHAQVMQLLSRFDRPEDQILIELRTYRLANALASDLAAVLNSTQTTLFQAASQAEGEEAAGGQQETGALFSVTADNRTNSLVVTAPAAVQTQVATLLQELDTPQQQVNVQVRLQEIQTRTADRLGINIAGGIGQLTASILDGGLSFLFDPHAAVSAFNIGAVLDALETQGLSRRVDDSSLTVLNNSPTSIQAGGTILISIPGSAENIERTIPYGVQIDVTPRVAADGRITLTIDARVEDVLSSLENPSLLELATRAVSSTITLDPGQTVLLSGLMQNQYTETVNQVPVLGALPIIGNLFRSTLAELSETELLIIVTADVID